MKEVGIGKYTKGGSQEQLKDSNKGEEGTESRLPIKIQNLVYTESSGNRTPCSRFYSDLLDTLADSACIHQLVLERRSKR